MNATRRFVSLAACVVATFAFATPASAQTWPSGPVTIVVPFTPGTGIDIIARALGTRLAEKWGQPVVVDNKPGASGNIGTEIVARANPDGHTLLMQVNTLVMNVSLMKSVPYDPVRDFEPVSLTAWGALMLVAHPSLNVATVAELVRAAKAAPGKISYGSPGVGTPHHMSMELFRSVSGVELLHVPYKGTAGAVNDLLGGQVQTMFLPVHVGLQHVKAGKLRALAIGSPQRSTLAPEVPTLKEAGVDGVEVDMWYGLFAPRGTPKDLVGRLNGELAALIGSPQLAGFFAGQGLVPATSTPGELRALVEKDLAKWATVVRQAKISAE